MAGQKTVTGSLHDDKGTWVVRGRVYDPDTGKTKNRSKSTGYKVKDNTKRKAQQKMAEILAQWEDEANGEIVYITSEPLFSEYVNCFLDKKQGVLKGNTVKTYRGYAEKHILPALGDIPVRKLTLQKIQAFYNDLFEQLKVGSVKKMHVVVSGALLEAVREGLISTNVADYAEFPKAQKFEGKAYTPEQAVRFLDALKKEGEPLRAAGTLALCYGLRREEIVGLRWSDIDFKQNTLTVRNTVVQEGDLRIEEERTKTQKSKRSIALVPGTVPYLLELQQRQEQAGLVLDKVCAWPDGRIVRPDYLTRHIPKFMERADLPVIRLHDLRHTAASILAMSCSPKQVQDFLGHEDISTTMNIYTHTMDSQRRETSDALGGILKKAGYGSENRSEMSSTDSSTIFDMP